MIVWDYKRGLMLTMIAGGIQGAVNVEILSQRFKSINFILEGVNGQMPNLDLFNALNQLCRQRSISVTIQKQSNYPKYGKNQLIHTMKTLSLSAWTQASGVSIAAHSPFLKFGIPALTIRSDNFGRGRESNILDIGYVVEGLARSLNNLLERFHQSFFFYILPNTDRYISIGLYMPPIGALAAPLIIKALVLWITIENVNFAPLPLPFMLSFIFGYITYNSANHLIKIGAPLRISAAETISLGFIAIFLVSLVIPKVLRRKIKEAENFWDPKLMQCVLLIVFTVILSVVTILNGSLGAIILIFSVPGLLLSFPTSSWLQYSIKTFFLILASPISIVFINMCLKLYLTDNLVFKELLIQFGNVLTMSIVSSEWFGSWAFMVITGFIFPLWTLFWICLHTPLPKAKQD